MPKCQFHLHHRLRNRSQPQVQIESDQLRVINALRRLHRLPTHCQPRALANLVQLPASLGHFASLNASLAPPKQDQCQMAVKPSEVQHHRGPFCWWAIEACKFEEKQQKSNQNCICAPNMIKTFQFGQNLTNVSMWNGARRRSKVLDGVLEHYARQLDGARLCSKCARAPKCTENHTFAQL